MRKRIGCHVAKHSWMVERTLDSRVDDLAVSRAANASWKLTPPKMHKLEAQATERNQVDLAAVWYLESAHNAFPALTRFRKTLCLIPN